MNNKLPQLRINNSTQTIITLSAIVGAVYFSKKLWDRYQSTLRDKNYGNSPAYQSAVAIRNATNPSGIDWMINFDGTNEKALFEIVSNIKNKTQWDELVAVYNKAYGESIIDRLNKELDHEELLKFNTILNANISGTGSGTGSGNTGTNTNNTTVAWVGKRVKLKKGLDNYIYWSNKSDIGEDSKRKIAILKLTSTTIPASWTKDWRCTNRTTISKRVGTWLFGNSSLITVEFIEIRIPLDGGKYEYFWTTPDKWQLF